MFRLMRRGRQALPPKECREILSRGTCGVLSVLGDGGYPYGVPLSYVYDGESIYFHCAKEGHKLDAIRQNDKVSFCVVGQDEVKPKEYTTYFQSVIVFGRARVLKDEGEKREALKKLAVRYSPKESEEGRTREMERFFDHVLMIALQIEHMTGKQAKELVKAGE